MALAPSFHILYTATVFSAQPHDKPLISLNSPRWQGHCVGAAATTLKSLFDGHRAARLGDVTGGLCVRFCHLRGRPRSSESRRARDMPIATELVAMQHNMPNWQFWRFGIT